LCCRSAAILRLEVLVMAENSSGKPGGMPGRPIGTVSVDITHQDHKTFEAIFMTEAKSFQLMIDLPVIRGGKGTGPTPRG
jgi:hypothetical protein